MHGDDRRRHLGSNVRLCHGTRKEPLGNFGRFGGLNSSVDFTHLRRYTRKLPILPPPPSRRLRL